ncbi:MAG: hypothetical protein ACJAYN_002517 [Bermanella sp.]|jgi:hypothetical protein
MIAGIQSSEKSHDLPSLRQLNNDENQQFSQILGEAKNQQGTAIKTLLAMTNDELALIQKAHYLADPINVASLSEEGATNLLSRPGRSDKVDLNNDGIVEVGSARTIAFPPANAPEHINTAWDRATEGMDEGDKLMLEIHMQMAIFGPNIEGVERKQALSPDQQWSQMGIDDLFKNLKAGLEFAVNLDGWTEANLTKKGFYERFESALNQSSTTVRTATQTAPNIMDDAINKKEPVVHKTDSPYSDMMQLLLDANMGIDREKLEKIEEKTQEIENDINLDGRHKQQLIKPLQQQKEVMYAEALERKVENEQRQNLKSHLFEYLQEQQLKSNV